MTIQKIQTMNMANPVFTSGNQNDKPELTAGQKIGMAATTAVGVGAALVGMAKLNKFPVNPKILLKTPLKDTFLNKQEYFEKEVIALGLGSCAGGLAGGAIFDKKENLPAKKREVVVQLCNAVTPILFVGAGARLADNATPALKKFVKPVTDKLNLGAGMKKFIGVTPKIAASIAGLGVGMLIGNRISHAINNKLFGEKEDRPVSIKDLCAHTDDMCEIASFISTTNPVVHAVSRVIPIAMMVPGLETAKAKAKE